MQPLLILVVSITLLLVGGLIGYWWYRRVLREAKNYERGLKMIPLLIHLPPLSDDIDASSRDSREVAEETISKAQVLYNIIASTTTKGFKSRFYGQRHFSFEIIASKGVVNYYAAVPIALVSVVEQAVTSAYPSARLEEVHEHNIFSQVGKITGTIGGELVLKKEFANPIATYQETKRDAMQSILNSLATLTKDDGAAIQILLRPAREGWTKKAMNVASYRRKNKGKSGGFSGKTGGMISVRDIGEALWKPPESSDEKRQDDKQLSTLEQATIEAIEDKTRHPGYEVLIRVMASSNTAARSQAILSNIVASFTLFDSPGRNGFKFVPAKAIDSFVTAFIFRFFPPEVKQNILNSVELATLFHFPDQRNTPTSQLQRQASKQVDGPTNLPESGLLLGYNLFRGTKKEIRLTEQDRRRHMYIIGQTGTGKSVLLENLALQDMLDGKGFAFIDPHGDSAETILGMVPKERTEDIIYFAPGEMDFPVGLNLFEYDLKEQRDFLIQEAINMLYKLYDPQRQGIIGPRYEHLFRNAALTVMAGPDGGTFIDIPKLFNDKQYVNQKLKYVTDSVVLDFWLKEMPGSERSNEFGEVKSWFVSKFGAFLSNEMMRNIIGQTKSGFSLRNVMDEGKILIVNLSKGKTGELNAKLLGMIFVMKFYAAAMGRANVHESERKDFTLYVDEFQNFSTETFSDILSEARKYRLSLIVANQFVGQLTDEIRDAVFGNVGTVVSSRTGANDADFLVKYFSPIFDTEDLTKMPNYNWAVQMLMNGVPTQPFSMETIPPLGKPNIKLTQALKRLSSAKYGKPRAVVEKDIFSRLRTEVPEARSPLDSMSRRPGSLPGKSHSTSQTPKNSSNSSFLDEWLAKRRKEMAQKPPVERPLEHPEPVSRLSEQPKPVQQNQENHNELRIKHEPTRRVRRARVNPRPTTNPKAIKRPEAAAKSPSGVKIATGGQAQDRETLDSQFDRISLSEDQSLVEDIVVGKNAGQVPRADQIEQGSGINAAIQESQLAAGEIAIDDKGLIHHSKEDIDELNGDI